jgi:hypothetical protein
LRHRQCPLRLSNADFHSPRCSLPIIERYSSRFISVIAEPGRRSFEINEQPHSESTAISAGTWISSETDQWKFLEYPPCKP